MTELYEAMSTLRAVRRLRPDPIPDDVLERVLQAACWAPTGGNQQPWRVVVVTDPDRKAALQGIYAPEWARYAEGFLANLAHLPADGLAKWQRVAAAGDHLAEHLHDAPAILVFCADPKRMAITDADTCPSGFSIARIPKTKSVIPRKSASVDFIAAFHFISRSAASISIRSTPTYKIPIALPDPSSTGR